MFLPSSSLLCQMSCSCYSENQTDWVAGSHGELKLEAFAFNAMGLNLVKWDIRSSPYQLEWPNPVAESKRDLQWSLEACHLGSCKSLRSSSEVTSAGVIQGWGPRAAHEAHLSEAMEQSIDTQPGLLKDTVYCVLGGQSVRKKSGSLTSLPVFAITFQVIPQP